MSKVFVVNMPIRRDDAVIGGYRPSIDVAPAAEHGDVVHVLPPGRVPEDPVALAAAVARGLMTFAPGDHLVFVGDLAACSMAGALTISLSGGYLRWLEWDKGERRYRARSVLVLDTLSRS